MNKKLLVSIGVLLYSFLYILFPTRSDAQSKRIVGIMFFNNQSSITNNWVGYGIEYLLYDKLKNVNAITVYEKETLNRVLKKVKAQNSRDLTARKIFSIGKFTGVELLFAGNYAVKNGRLAFNLKLYSTYTGNPVFDKTYTGDLNNIFGLVSQGILEALETIQIPLSPQEKSYIQAKPTNSLKAFESYCKAYVEISRGSPMEMIAGYFQRAIQEDPNFWEAPYNLGVIYYNFNLYDKALQLFDRVIQQRPDFYKAYYGKGVIFYLQRQYKKAIQLFQKVLELKPDHDRSYYYMGICQVRSKQLTPGIKSLEKSIELNPNYAPAYYQLALADMRRGWFRKAIVSLNKAVKLNPDFYLAYNALGEAYYSQNMFEEAIIAFKKAIGLHKSYARAYFNLANSIYKQGALAEIVEAFWAIMELQLKPTAKGDGGESNELMKLREQSKKQDPSKIYRAMITNYRKALKYNPKFYQASYNLALTYENRGNLDSAIYYYKKTISIKPKLSQAHMRLGKIYEKQKRYNEALREFEEVVKIDPSYFASHPQLGEEYRNVNIIEFVLQKYQARLSRNPRDAEALGVVGRIYFQLGRLGQAEQYFQQLVQLKPNDQLAQETLREIRKRLRKL